MKPVLLMIAGPNGSGKTTVTVRLYIYDNSVEMVDARLCARTHDGRLRKVYGPLPAWVAAAVEPLPRHGEFIDLRVA